MAVFSLRIEKLIGRLSYHNTSLLSSVELQKILTKNVWKLFCTNSSPVDVLTSKASQFSGEKSALFEDSKVQRILKTLTGLKYDVVFDGRKETLKNPVYKVLTNEEFLQEQRTSSKFAKETLLEMPSIMSKRRPIKVTLSVNPEIINHDEDKANFVFTDISASKTNRDRAVLVRENSTGVLREGTWDERDRMQFIYWPKEGQEYEIAPMLQDEHLPRVFEQNRHKDVLDFINIQCEADSPNYIRVHTRVYDDLDKRQMYHVLYSTRHYGGMIFHYVTNGNTNRVIEHFIEQKKIFEAIELVNLHLFIHKQSNLSEQLAGFTGKTLLKLYMEKEGMENSLKNLKIQETQFKNRDTESDELESEKEMDG